MYPTRFHIILVGFFLAALIVGALFFVLGMDSASYLVSDGSGVGIHYIDKPSYDAHFQGLIFTITFLAAGILLLGLVILPDQQRSVTVQRASAPPQPRKRSAGAPEPAQAAPQPPQPAPAAEPAAQPAAPGPTVEIEGEPEPETSQPERAPAKTRSVEEEVLTAQPEETAEIEDLPDARAAETGEEDVVYGSGRVDDDSIWEFIHNHPDSAVKFLYRKTLDNKPLSPTEEDIYRRWEMRGMRRAKVRELVLEIMAWKTLPDDFPHNIWRGLRDQIFENRSRASAA